MAEKKMQTGNIKIIADILKDSGLAALKDGFIESEKKIKDFKALLDAKLKELAEKKAADALSALQAEENAAEKKAEVIETPVAEKVETVSEPTPAPAPE